MGAAVDALIAELKRHRTSVRSEPIVSQVDVFVAALQELEDSEVPAGPQNANTVFAGPISGVAALPSFRTIGGADLAQNIQSLPNGTNGAPSVNFGDPTTGIYRPALNQIGFTIAGALNFLAIAGSFVGNNSGAAALMNSSASSTFATLRPNRSNINAGIGASSPGTVSIIAENAGVATEVARANGTQFQSILQFIGQGTPTNDNASNGQIGEYISSSVSLGSAVPLVTSTAKTITSISLTAGDWDVNEQLILNADTTTVTTRVISAISQTDNTLPAGNPDGSIASWVGNVTGPVTPIINSFKRISLAATTTIYLVGFGTFTVSTLTAYGFIAARRAR